MVKPWKQFRKDITKLYITEARPLHEVKKLMKERHGFDASIRSYRQRFDHWGLGKYNCKKRDQRRAEERQYANDHESSSMSPTTTPTSQGHTPMIDGEFPQQSKRAYPDANWLEHGTDTTLQSTFEYTEKSQRYSGDANPGLEIRPEHMFAPPVQCLPFSSESYLY